VDPNVDKCNAAKNGVDLFTGFGSLPTVGGSFCPSNGNASNCAAKVSGGFCVVKAGVKSCTHEVTYTGGTCTPPAPSPTESPVPTPCKGTYGQVNGVDVCLPLGTDPAATVEEGKKTEEKTTDSTGGTTTETTTEKSSCIGSKCTTEKTITTTAPDGTSTSKTETKDESKDDFCKTNPRSPQCITSSFSGSCGAIPSCSGDAIQCAIATDQIRRNCQMLEPDADANSVVNKALAGTDGINAEAMKASATVVNVGTFNQAGRSWSRSCPADPVIALTFLPNAPSWTIPFSRACGPLGLLANAAVAITLLGCLVFCVRGGAGG
jgi:hypothetical protein